MLRADSIRPYGSSGGSCCHSSSRSIAQAFGRMLSAPTVQVGKLLPFIQPLGCASVRADSIRPYGSSEEAAAIHPTALSRQVSGGFYPPLRFERGKLLPFIQPLSCASVRADAIRPYGSSGETAAIHPAAQLRKRSGGCYPPLQGMSKADTIVKISPRGFRASGCDYYLRLYPFSPMAYVKTGRQNCRPVGVWGYSSSKAPVYRR